MKIFLSRFERRLKGDSEIGESRIFMLFLINEWPE